MEFISVNWLQKIIKNSLAKNSILYFIGQSGERIVYTIAIPILVVALTPEEYGIYGLIISAINLAPLLLSQGFTSVVSRLYFDRKINVDIMPTIAKYLLFISTVVFILSTIIYFINFEFNRLLGISGAIVAVNILSTVFTGVLVAKEQAFRNSMTSAISGAIFLVLLLLLNFYNILNILTLMLVYLVGRFSFLVLISIKNFSLFSGNFHFSIIRSYLSFSSPFIIHTGSIWFLSLGSRWILSFFSDLEKVGALTLYTQIANTLVWLINPINISFSPRLSKHYIDGGIDDLVKFHNKTFSIYFYSGFLFAVLLLIVGLVYIIYFADKFYQNYLILLPMLIVGFFFQILYFPLINIKQSFKDSKAIAKITIISSVVSLILNIILINLFDIYGAALASLFTYIFLFILYRINLKDIPLNFKISNPFKLLKNL